MPEPGDIPTGAEGDAAKATPAADKADAGQVGATPRPSGAAEVNLDVLASEMYPPKTIPQFKMTDVDPLKDIITGEQSGEVGATPDRPTRPTLGITDRQASEMYPPKIVPQFKRTEIDPLAAIVTDKPAGVAEDEVKEVKWRDGDPIIDRKGSTERDERPDGEPSNQISDKDKSIDIAKVGDPYRTLAEDLRKAADSNGESKQKSHAEVLEYWAEEIHDHPDAAGEMAPQDCINLDNWIGEYSNEPDYYDEKIEELKAMDASVGFGVSQVLGEFEQMFGRNEFQSDVHRRLKELTSKNNTTMGELKEFLYGEIGKKADGWRNSIDVAREKLAVIQGK